MATDASKTRPDTDPKGTASDGDEKTSWTQDEVEAERAKAKTDALTEAGRDAASLEEQRKELGADRQKFFEQKDAARKADQERAEANASEDELPALRRRHREEDTAAKNERDRISNEETKAALDARRTELAGIERENMVNTVATDTGVNAETIREYGGDSEATMRKLAGELSPKARSGDDSDDPPPDSGLNNGTGDEGPRGESRIKRFLNAGKDSRIFSR